MINQALACRENMTLLKHLFENMRWSPLIYLSVNILEVGIQVSIYTPDDSTHAPPSPALVGDIHIYALARDGGGRGLGDFLFNKLSQELIFRFIWRYPRIKLQVG